MSTPYGYIGPACPHCNRPFDLRQVQTDAEDICASCQQFFEARVFHPPQRVARVLQVAQAGPEGASACANHPRNAAVTSCERCGVFICSLCELDISGMRYCPSCFDRLSANGTLSVTQNRFRDYATLALVTAFVGFLFSAIVVGIPIAALSIYYVIRGFRSAEIRHGRMTALIVALVVSAIDIGIGIVMLAQFLK
jgi:uncharacterized paraquat-inducible protein A